MYSYSDKLQFYCSSILIWLLFADWRSDSRYLSSIWWWGDATETPRLWFGGWCSAHLRWRHQAEPWLSPAPGSHSQQRPKQHSKINECRCFHERERQKQQPLSHSLSCSSECSPHTGCKRFKRNNSWPAGNRCGPKPTYSCTNT